MKATVWRTIAALAFVTLASQALASFLLWVTHTGRSDDTSSLQAPLLGLIGVGGILVLSGLIERKDHPPNHGAADPTAGNALADAEDQRLRTGLTAIGTAMVGVGAISVAMIIWTSKLGFLITLAAALLAEAVLLTITMGVLIARSDDSESKIKRQWRRYRLKKSEGDR